MKKGFIITLLLTAIVLTGCSSKGEIKTEEAKTEYFDFSPTEIVSRLEEEFLIDFTPFNVVDSYKETETIVSYTSKTDIFNRDEYDINANIHYQFTCDDITNKVSSISFLIDKNSAKALERYFLHMLSIATCIDTNTNIDDISNAIEKGFNENDYAIYRGENFELYATQNDKFLDVLFNPIENTEGVNNNE